MKRSNMKNYLMNIKKVCINHPIWALGIISILYHSLMILNLYDDAVYTTILDSYSYKDFMNYLYYNWSSRLVIHTVLLYVIEIQAIWFILDIVFFATTPLLMSKLCNCQGKEVFFCCALVLLYPFEDMKSAGWMTTTVIFWWPLWAILFFCIMIREYASGKAMKSYEYVIGIVLLLFLCNLEQTSCIMLFILLGFLFYAIYEKKYRVWFLYLCFFVNVVSLIFILTCPGNTARGNATAQAIGIAYEKISIIDKAILGLLYIEKIFLASPNRVFVIMCILLVLFTVILNAEIWKIVISMLPLAVVIGYLLVGKAFPRFQPLFATSEDVLCVNYMDYRIYVQLFFLLITASGIVATLYFLLGKNKKKFVFIMIVFAGTVLSTVAVAISASLYISGFRIFVFLYFAIIYVCVECVVETKVFDLISRKNYLVFSIPFYTYCGLNLIYITCMCYAAGRLNG